jgi:hypothetical protein
LLPENLRAAARYAYGRSWFSHNIFGLRAARTLAP